MKLKQHPKYETWHGMKARCYNPNSINYENYGGRGIRVCEEWRISSRAFILWCEEQKSQRGELDRRDNNGNYSPLNCHFVSPTINCCNRRRKIFNISGYTGVYKRWGKYEGQIKYRGKVYHIGTFLTAGEAAAARDRIIIRARLPHKLQVYPRRQLCPEQLKQI